MMFSYGKSSRENYNDDDRNYNWAFFNFYPNNLKYTDYYYCCSDAIATYKKHCLLPPTRNLLLNACLPYPLAISYGTIIFKT